MPTDKSFIEAIIEIFQQEREASKKSSVRPRRWYCLSRITLSTTSSPTFVGFFVSILIILIHYLSNGVHTFGVHTPIGVWNQIDKWTTLPRTERIKTKSINSTKFLTLNPKRRGVGCDV